MLRIVLTFFLIALGGIARADGPYKGLWRGVGVQSDGSTWEMEAKLGPTRARVVYPGLNCGGRWAYEETAPGTLTGVETIEYGLENCFATGRIYLQATGAGRLLFLWCGEGGKVSALAVLSQDLPGYDARLAASEAALGSLGFALDSVSCRGGQWLGI